MTPRETVLSYLSSFSTGEPDAVAAHVSEDFQNNQVGVIGDGCTGRETYRRRLKDFLATFQGLHYTPEKIVESDGDVAVAYRMTAVDGGHPVDIRGVMMITVVDGEITVRSDYWDGLTYNAQVGEGS